MIFLVESYCKRISLLERLPRNITLDYDFHISDLSTSHMVIVKGLQKHIEGRDRVFFSRFRGSIFFLKILNDCISLSF